MIAVGVGDGAGGCGCGYLTVVGKADFATLLARRGDDGHQGDIFLAQSYTGMDGGSLFLCCGQISVKSLKP